MASWAAFSGLGPSQWHNDLSIIISSRKLGNPGAVKSCLVSIGIRVKFPVKSLITQPIHSCVSQDNMCEWQSHGGKQQEAVWGRGPRCTGKLVEFGGIAMFYAIQTKLLVTVESDVTISIHLLLAYHDYLVCTGESPTLRCSHTHRQVSFSPAHLTVHINKGTAVRQFLSNSGAFEKWTPVAFLRICTQRRITTVHLLNIQHLTSSLETWCFGELLDQDLQNSTKVADGIVIPDERTRQI